jgi:hypothetical protein
MALAMRGACDEEGTGDGGRSIGGQVTATRAMTTEGKQQSTSNGTNKRWVVAGKRASTR